MTDTSRAPDGRYWPTVLLPERITAIKGNEALRAQPEPPSAEGNPEQERDEETSLDPIAPRC